MFAGSFGRSGSEVVIEEFLQGEEVSFFALCDGERALSFGTAQDHKRVGEGDTGPNTGGMGAYSPASALTPAMEALVLETIVEPTLRAMREMGAPYRGVLYAGLMLTAEGPKLIEYNARLGDPEAQVILPRLEDDLLELMLAAARGALPERAPRFSQARGADRGSGGEKLSGDADRRHANSRTGARRGGGKRHRHPCGHEAGRRASFWPPAGACSMSRRWPTRSWRPRLGPTRPSTSSTGPAAFAGATSAGARSRASGRRRDHPSSPPALGASGLSVSALASGAPTAGVPAKAL